MRLALPLLLLTSCTASQAFVVTGESVDTLGKQFVAASNALQAGLREGRVSPEDFKKWAAFSERFDVSYSRLVDAWKAARAIKDDVAARDLEAAIGRIAVELAGWYALAQKLGAP